MHSERAIAYFFIIPFFLSVVHSLPYIESISFCSTKVSFYQREHAWKTIQSVSQNLNRICWTISSYKTQFSVWVDGRASKWASDRERKSWWKEQTKKFVLSLQTMTANEHLAETKAVFELWAQSWVIEWKIRTKRSINNL